MLDVVMQNVVMQHVVMLNVVAPKIRQKIYFFVENGTLQSFRRFGSSSKVEIRSKSQSYKTFFFFVTDADTK
jgi:hypothetical protein